MSEENEYSKYYRGNDLMNRNKKILFEKITEGLAQCQWGLAAILSQKEKNPEKIQKYTQKIDQLKAAQAPVSQIKWQEDMRSTINHMQSNILQIIYPTFNRIFDEVAENPELWWLAYNEELRGDVWFDIVFGYRDISWGMEGGRDNYRLSEGLKNRMLSYDEIVEKNAEKRKKQKEKVWLPSNHQLLNKENYDTLKETMWTYLDTVVSIYQKKFLKDTTDSKQVQELINHYFLFIFLQMLIKSQIVFDMKKPKSTPFFQQVIDDCLVYIQKKYKISLSISSEDIKKKIFHTKDETSKPLELIYKNCTEEDLISREKYLDANFFISRQTSLDKIRRQIMVERYQNRERLEKWWELLNPLYHISQEKKEKILATIAVLEQYTGENKVMAEILRQFQENLKKTEEDIKIHTVLENKPIPSKEPESLIKIEQQYLKFYQVPVQYRKMFGVVINRLNNFHQVKGNLAKKSDISNNLLFDNLVHSDQKSEDILYYINNFITKKDISVMFDKKWNNRQKEKIETIQSFCLGIQKVDTLSKKKKSKETEWQHALEF